ncbi:MAG: DUF460 domain-containing protein [Methanohalobium sp.]|uniref:DUF460 domain-containing protein n=1 Tax=Methanohalobium sp. TaxID=2837493 RepID=UPI00397B2EF5
MGNKTDTVIIYGIDIAKGSPKSKEVPKYSVAVLKDGEFTHYTMVHRHKILRMIHKDRPDIIALDNIFELAENKKNLIQFLERLPKGVKLVQVTGGLHPKSLVRLANEYNLTLNQFDPNEEAEVCARLAAMGVGSEISLFENITKIKVSRARSLGRGGWSQNRYRRKVHGAVKEKSREIESILKNFSKEKGFAYDSKVTKGFGGYVRCEFTVYAGRDEVPVRSTVGGDVQVKVKGVERDKIKYIPLDKHDKQKRKFTIVGIDPGTTVGIAVLSLDAELLYLKSFRGISHDEVVKLVSEYGKPVVVATDVIPTPNSVEKIRRSFKAIEGKPDARLSSEEKIALSKPYGYSNDHERDALAAALYSYRNHKNVFSKVEKRTPSDIDIDQVKLNVMYGDTIEEAIEKVKSPKEEDKSKPESVKKQQTVIEEGKPEEYQKLIETINRQKSQIKHMQDYINQLKKNNELKDEKISKLEFKIDNLSSKRNKEIKKDKEIKIRDNKISRLKSELKNRRKSLKRLKSQINNLKQIRKMEIKGEGIPVKIVASFTKDDISKTKELYGLKPGDLIYLEDASGGGASTASMLINAGIKAVIVSNDLSHAAYETFFEKNIPILKDISIQRADDFAIVDPDELESAMSKWNEFAKERHMEEKEKEFMNLVNEYRSERRRGLI